MKTKAPCINCKKRKPGCHDTCEEYKEWIKKRHKGSKVTEEITYYFADKFRRGK